MAWFGCGDKKKEEDKVIITLNRHYVHGIFENDLQKAYTVNMKGFIEFQEDCNIVITDKERLISQLSQQVDEQWRKNKAELFEMHEYKTLKKEVVYLKDEIEMLKNRVKNLKEKQLCI